MSPLSPNNNVVPPEWLSDHLESYQGAETIHSDMSIEFPPTNNKPTNHAVITNVHNGRAAKMELTNAIVFL